MLVSLRAPGVSHPPCAIPSPCGQMAHPWSISAQMKGKQKSEHDDAAVFGFELRLDMDRHHAAFNQRFQAGFDPVTHVMRG